MKLLYVGIGRIGTTSYLRARTIEAILADWSHHQIDTWPPFARQSWISRSLAFRMKRGPAVSAINRHVATELGKLPSKFDLVWVDKGVFLKPEIIRLLRNRCRQMIHYTPDSAFYQNRSRHFEESASLYDLLVTTKSFELDHYRKCFPSTRLLLTTQGYDDTLHCPHGSFADKSDQVVFAGLCEPSRERALEALIDAGIPVHVAGHGWQTFAARHCKNARLRFTDGPVEGSEYAQFLSSGKLGLGLLSKRFPELHTTRTFEIPACGTALVTETNEETSAFFSSGEAVFYEDETRLFEAVTRALSDQERLVQITDAGRARVQRDGRSNHAILNGILKEILEN